jgi:hypothetical protein
MAGKAGVITVEEAKTLETSLEVSIGQTLYEDQRGVRSYVENGALLPRPMGGPLKCLRPPCAVSVAESVLSTKSETHRIEGVKSECTE